MKDHALPAVRRPAARAGIERWRSWLSLAEPISGNGADRYPVREMKRMPGSKVDVRDLY